MKKLALLGLLSSSLMSTHVFAENNEICDTQLYLQLQTAEKQGFKRPNIRPNRALAEKMSDAEILCPTQIENDFNGDKRLDWIGVLEKDGRFYLMAYLSSSTTHRLQQIKEFKSPPNNQYLDVANQQRLYEVAGHFEFRPEVKLAIIENRMDGSATAYLFDGQSMKQLVDFKWPLEKEDT